MHSEKTIKEFQKWGKTPPASYEHGLIEDINLVAQRLMPEKWWMEGNILKGKTKIGTVAQYLPTNVILERIDEQGLPVFKKVDK